MRRNNGISVGFVDTIFNIAFGFIILFILAFILINVKKKDDVGKITPKAEYLIEMVWNNDSDDDIDIHVKDPQGNTVNFKSRTSGIMFLDKDDLGHSSDRIKYPDGTERIIPINKEIITLRGTYPGRYVVNVHFYNKRTEIGYVNDVVVTLIKLNPFSQVAVATKKFDTEAQEQTAFTFKLDDRGNVYDVNYEDEEKLFR